MNIKHERLIATLETEHLSKAAASSYPEVCINICCHINDNRIALFGEAHIELLDVR